MLRNIQKAIRPLATTPRPAVFQNQLRGLAFSAFDAAPRGGTLKSCGGSICTRRYGTNVPPGKSSETLGDSKVRWIDYLEAVSKASWLSSTPKKPENILKRCYSLVFHIIAYLARPMSKDPKESQLASTSFLMLFTSALVGSDTEIGRARYAIAIITKQLTSDISSIPRSSPLRSKHSSVFTLASELVTPCDIYLENLQQNKPPPNGEIVEIGKWHDFWSKIQTPLLALGEALDKAGYGITDDLMKEAAAEKEMKEKRSAK